MPPTPAGLRPPFVIPAAAHSHPHCCGILTLIVAPHSDPHPGSHYWSARPYSGVSQVREGDHSCGRGWRLSRRDRRSRPCRHIPSPEPLDDRGAWKPNSRCFGNAPATAMRRAWRPSDKRHGAPAATARTRMCPPACARRSWRNGRARSPGADSRRRRGIWHSAR